MNKNRARSHRLTLCPTLIALIVATSSLSQTGELLRVTDPGVQRRMNTMATAKTAITTLGDMMGGRALFDREKARAARKDLIAATREVPAVFRKPLTDPLSRARPLIWSRWDDFTIRSKSARKAAWAVDTSSLPRLRKSLPNLLVNCLKCHETYRLPVR